MNIVDILILLFLIYGFIIGWKNGFVKQLVFTVGLVLLFAFSYSLKDPISTFFYKHIPFLSFNGIETLNIVVFEFLSFIIVFLVLFIIFRILLKISSFAEKILKLSAFVVSKILGSILGVIECFVITFAILFFLSLPIFEINSVKTSNLANKILTKTFILSDMCNNSLVVYGQINELKNEYKNNINKDELNNKIVDLIVDKNLISKDNLNYLIEHDKIQNINIEK